MLHTNLNYYTNIKGTYSVPNILKKQTQAHTHTQKQMSMVYPPICQQPKPHDQSRFTTI